MTGILLGTGRNRNQMRQNLGIRVLRVCLCSHWGDEHLRICFVRQRSVPSGVRLPGLYSYLCWAAGNHALNCLCLGFLICKTGILISPHRVVRSQRINVCQMPECGELSLKISLFPCTFFPLE